MKSIPKRIGLLFSLPLCFFNKTNLDLHEKTACFQLCGCFGSLLGGL